VIYNANVWNDILFTFCAILYNSNHLYEQSVIHI
jgi:hypothetical protein